MDLLGYLTKVAINFFLFVLTIKYPCFAVINSVLFQILCVVYLRYNLYNFWLECVLNKAWCLLFGNLLGGKFVCIAQYSVHNLNGLFCTYLTFTLCYSGTDEIIFLKFNWGIFGRFLWDIQLQIVTSLMVKFINCALFLQKEPQNISKSVINLPHFQTNLVKVIQLIKWQAPQLIKLSRLPSWFFLINLSYPK